MRGRRSPVFTVTPCEGMNPHEPPESFEAARRRHLIEATIEALADVGFKAASLSQIARRADVSTGLFAHYFGDKDGLLEATLRFMAARLVQATRNRLRAARTPRERLYAVPDSALADTEFERRTSAVWLAFWGQITHSARYQRIQFIYQRRMLSNLKHDLRKVVAADRVETYAEMIAAMIDGVWIRSHASATPREGSEARVLVRGLIDGLIAQAADGGERLQPPPTILRVQKLPAPAKTKREAPEHEDPSCLKQIEAARTAQRTWGAQSAAWRAETLRRIAREIEANGDELARLEAQITHQPVKKIAALCVARVAERMRVAAAQLEARRTLRIEHAPGLFEYHEPPSPALHGILDRCDAPLLGFLSPLARALRDGHGAFLAPGSASRALAERVAALAEGAGAPAALVQCLPRSSDGKLPADVYPAPPTDPPRTATILCADTDATVAAEHLARGLVPWAAGPDLGQTPVFVAARRLPLVARAIDRALGRLATGDPLDPTTDVVRSSLTTGEDWARALAAGAVRHRPNAACDVFTWEGAAPAPRFAPGLLLIAYADEAELLAQLAAGDPWDTLGLLPGADGPARRLANQIPARTVMRGTPEPGGAEFLTLVAAADAFEPVPIRRIFWGADRGSLSKGFED